MLTDLAPDLLQHVLAQLTSACAVISTARTCSAFNAVAYSDGIWTALAKARFRLVREILIVESENSAHGGYALYRVHTRLSIGCRNLDLYRSCLRPLPADALSTEATTAPEIDEFVFSFELRKGSTLIANASCRYDRIWREEDRCKDSDLGVESGGGCSVDLPLWTALPNVGRSPPGTGWQAGWTSEPPCNSLPQMLRGENFGSFSWRGTDEPPVELRVFLSRAGQTALLYGQCFDSDVVFKQTGDEKFEGAFPPMELAYTDGTTFPDVDDDDLGLPAGTIIVTPALTMDIDLDDGEECFTGGSLGLAFHHKECYLALHGESELPRVLQAVLEDRSSL
mmetsp:Transcript_36232/g.116723  ORF Transcript_36232/g.116723 Transcript_36232/m.116723 type:complete len:338 (-) Transcript_36232:143-1156(-)